MGLLRVGPHSAGADPGPACYGFGGSDATVTDACVALGYFDPDAFLGGTMRLDPAAARRALERAGAPLGLDAVRTAWGIYSIVCENMAQAARLYLIERGQDPRRFALMGFGGAGPATAARVARLLGVRQVLIPPASGLASALGLLAAPLGFELGHSLTGLLDDLDWATVERLLAEMEEQGRAMVAEAGGDPGRVRCDRRVEMRYAGQFHDIEVPAPRPLDRNAADAIRARFTAEYERLYGGALPDYPIQALNWRVLVAGPPPDVDVRGSLASQPALAAAQKRRRPIFVPGAGFVEAPVYDRYLVPEGSTLRGPAILEEAEATTVLWPGDRLTVDAQRNLVIGVEARAAAEDAAPASAAAPGEGE
jgi:5-oxoprolinase (ATP-hydrolysing)/N-methylhydantoinase A